MRVLNGRDEVSDRLLVLTEQLVKDAEAIAALDLRFIRGAYDFRDDLERDARTNGLIPKSFI